MARSQLSNSDTLASGPAESPVELQTDLSGKRVEPRLASESARVLPGRPMWLGIHCTWMVKEFCITELLQHVAVWRSGNMIGLINEVTPR